MNSRDSKQRQSDNSVAGLRDAEKFMNQVVFAFDMVGVKSMTIIEKDGVLDFKNSGISAKAWVSLVKHIYYNYPATFAIAMKMIEDIESENEAATIH